MKDNSAFEEIERFFILHDVPISLITSDDLAFKTMILCITIRSSLAEERVRNPKFTAGFMGKFAGNHEYYSNIGAAEQTPAISEDTFII